MDIRDTLLLVSNAPDVRAELRKIFDSNYNILEASSCDQAEIIITQNLGCIASIIIDIKLFGKCSCITENPQLLSTIPVAAIINAGSVRSEHTAFELGAQEILTTPFYPVIVSRRVENMINLYRNKWNLESLVEEQSEALRHSNEVMVDTLSSIIEYRSIESGQHIQRIRGFTRMLLEDMAVNCPEYGLTERSIQSIASAAALHDIGKIAIPDAILNKPGRLTAEEYEIMKTHSVAGSSILKSLGGMTDEEYLRYAYNICRYHHERWDGRGYPDGLKGDNIPICAQVVGLADVYDALTTDRVYKSASTCDEAVNMILNGECGAFSDKLLECFKHVLGAFEELAHSYADGLSPNSNAITAPLPPPSKAAHDTLHAALIKYQALLHHVNATVIEIDYDQNMYHVVYNPHPDFVSIESADSFELAMIRMAQKSLHPDDRAMITEQLRDYLDEFFASGLRKRTRSYRLRKTDDSYSYIDATILRTDFGDGSRKAICLMAEAAGESAVSGNIPHKLYDSTGIETFMGSTQHLIYDSRLSMQNVSRRLCVLLDYTEDEIFENFGGSFINMIPGEDVERVVNSLKEQFAAGNWCEVEIPLTKSDGSRIWVLVKGVLTRDSRATEHIHCMILNITASKKAQEDLRLTAERYALITEQTSDIVFEWDFISDKITCSPKYEERFGFPHIADNATASVMNASRFHPDDIPDLLSALGLLKAGEQFAEITVRMITSKGRYTWNRIRATTQFDEKGKPLKAIGIIIDLDHQLQSSQHLLDMVDRDSLTTLLNKDAARRQIETWLPTITASKRSALAIIDLDNFKDVNDTFGHMLGDEVLKQISAEISRMFRGTDIVARIGGDEFMVFMADVPNRELVVNRCETLIKNIHSLYKDTLHGIELSCSVGVAFYPEHGTGYQELFLRADRALYESKKLGKSRCVCWSPTSNMPLNLAVSSTRIDSDDRPITAGNSLINYVLERMQESGDVYATINSVIEMVAKYINVDRIYIFENNDDNTTCSNTFEWCGEGIPPEIDNLQDISYITDIPEYDKNFNERGIFYCPDVSRLPQNLRDILEPQGVKSLLHCAIRDNGQFRGYVGFDDCKNVRLWTQDQIDVLSQLSQILSVFLLKERSQDRMERMLEEVNSVLNNQYAWVYVIDPDTFELKFINERTCTIAPNAKLGTPCYKTFMNRRTPCPNCPAIRKDGDKRSVIDNKHLNLRVTAEAQSLHWRGKKSWLITCREKTD